MIAEVDVAPLVTLNAPVVIRDALLPDLVSYNTFAAAVAVFATRVIEPVWLIRLFEIKLMLEPMALLVIAPVWVMPMADPAAALLPVIVMLLPLELIVMAPKDTMVEDAPPEPVTVRLLAVINPVAEIGTAVAVGVDCVASKVIAPPLIVPAISMPAAVVVVVVMVMACPAALILPVL